MDDRLPRLNRTKVMLAERKTPLSLLTAPRLTCGVKSTPTSSIVTAYSSLGLYPTVPDAVGDRHRAVHPRWRKILGPPPPHPCHDP